MKSFIQIIFLSVLIEAIFLFPVMANTEKPLQGEVNDPFVEAQEKLMYAKGSYKTISQQEKAIENMRKAAKLSLKASKLRSKAEKLQNKANLLVTRANQDAVNKGLYITNPLSPVMMQPPPGVTPGTLPPEKTAAEPPPVPGQLININIPQQQEEVSLDSNQDDFNTLPAPPVSNF